MCCHEIPWDIPCPTCPGEGTLLCPVLPASRGAIHPSGTAAPCISSAVWDLILSTEQGSFFTLLPVPSHFCLSTRVTTFVTSKPLHRSSRGSPEAVPKIWSLQPEQSCLHGWLHLHRLSIPSLIHQGLGKAGMEQGNTFQSQPKVDPGFISVPAHTALLSGAAVF